MRKTLFSGLLGATLWLCANVAFAAPNPQVELTIAGRGKIVLELYEKEAPKTVAHFEDLIKKKFYNGILFHRVIANFVAQAGDPKSKTFKSEQLLGKSDAETGQMGLGNGGSGKNIPFEANEKTHEVGTIAMALSGPRTATGDSQFFINLVANHRLDGDYCVFGKVVKGLDVVQKIQQGDKIASAVVIKAPAKK